MKKNVFLKFFTFFMAFSLIFSVVSVTSFASENKTYVSIGGTPLYNGQAPDAETFETVYYKNSGSLEGNEDDYNAKLEYDAEKGFILTLNALKVDSVKGEYSIYAASNLNIVMVGDNTINHTVYDNNTKDKYAIRVDGNLSVSGDGELNVYLSGACDFKALSIHAARAYEINGKDKINAIDDRSEELKQIESIKESLENQISKTNYDLAIAKLNFEKTTDALRAEISTAKTIAVVAIVIGAISLVVNAIIGLCLVIKKKNVDDFDDED